MTILYAVRRQSFALIAADQLFTGIRWSPEGTEPYSDFHCKIRVLSEANALIATAGQANLVDEDLATFVANSLKGLANVPFEVALAMQPAILFGHLSCEWQRTPEHLRVPLRSTVVAGHYDGSEARLYAFIVEFPSAGPGRVEGVNTGLVSPSPSLNDFYRSGRFAIDSHRYAHHLDEPEALAEFLTQAVLDGIDHEATVSAAPTAGGQIDIAIVDQNGARFFDITST